jgi:class 3 adenylate cyclase
VNRRFAQQLADGIAGARFVELTSRSTALLPWIEGGDEVASLVEEFLTGPPVPVVPDRVLATVLFTDVVESTQQAAALGDLRWNEVLDRHDAIVQSTIRRFRGRWIKATGDGVLATFDGPARAVHCAEATRDGLAATGIRIRGGVHTGEIELRGDDVGGLGVHIAARVMTHALPGEIVASRTVKELAVGSGIDFRPLGDRELKGVPDRWELFAANSPAAG